MLKSVTRLPGNSIGIPSRAGSSGQTQLTELYFQDAIFNQQCAMIEVRGNPIDASGDYFVPQNGGATPTNTDRSRYATITFYDFQKDLAATIEADTTLQALLFPGVASGTAATYIGQLIAFVNNQMTATDGTGGIPAGLQTGLGPINGDGTGNGNSSGLPPATHLGNVVKIQHPSARQLIPNVAPAYAETVLFDSPSAYWRLGEASGTAAADATGDGHTGTYSGTLTLGAAGAIVGDPNTGISLNGTTGLMSLSDAWAPAGTSPRTIECWFKTTASFSVGQYQGVLNYGTSTFNEVVGVIMGTDTNFGTNGIGVSQYGDGVGVPGLNDGSWHHGVITFDGSLWSIYIDGVFRASKNMTTNTVPGGTLSVGTVWNGSLDEVAVYPAVLSADRILAHYNAGKRPMPGSWPSSPASSCSPVIFSARTPPAPTARAMSPSPSATRRTTPRALLNTWCRPSATSSTATSRKSTSTPTRPRS